MKKYLSILKNNPLFAKIDERDLETMLDCLSAKVKSFDKNGIILMAGDHIDKVGIVVDGSVHIVKEDLLGNRTIIAQIEPGQIFAEAFSCAAIEKLPVSVIANVNSTVLFIDYNKIVYTCDNSCTFHHRLLENMLGILARKNILLNNKIEHISKRTIKEKVLSYLSSQAQQQEKRRFSIPFNRQEGKLRDEGIIEFNKNEFRLLAEDMNEF